MIQGNESLIRIDLNKSGPTFNTSFIIAIVLIIDRRSACHRPISLTIGKFTHRNTM